MKTTLISTLCVLSVFAPLLQAQTPASTAPAPGATPPPSSAPVVPQTPMYEGPKPSSRFEVDVFGGYRFGGGLENAITGKDIDFDDSEAYGLTFDLGPVNSEMKVEFQWSRQDTSLDFHGSGGVNNVDVSIDEFQLGGIAEMGKNRFREYVAASAGATHFSSDFGDDTRFSFGLGVGVKYYVASHFVVRGDLRGFCTIVDSDSAFIFHNGVTVAAFSGSTLWQGQATIGVGIVF